MSRRRALSTTEVLVVAAIVAVLLALLFPRLSALRASARRTSCLANTRKLSHTAQMYMKDFNAFIVLDQAQLNETGNWMNDLSPYGNDEKMRQCASTSGTPARPGSAEKPWRWPEPSRITTGGYGYNGWLYDPVRLERPERIKPGGKGGQDLDVDNANPKNFYTITTAIHRDRIPMFVDAIWSEVFPLPSDYVADLQIGTYTACENQMGRSAIDRHNKKVDVAFLDGHSETVSIPALWTLEWNAQWQTPANLPVVE